MSRKKVLYLLIFVFTCILIGGTFLVFNLSKNANLRASLQLSDVEKEAIDYYKTNEITFGVYSEDKESKFIFETISQDLDLNSKIINYTDFDLLLNDVESGVLDLSTNMTFSNNDKELLDYSVPISIDRIYLFSKNGNLLKNMDNITIGLRKGCGFKEYLEENFNNINIVDFETKAEMLALLDQDVVDGVVSNTIYYEDAVTHGYKTENLNTLFTVKATEIVTMKGENTAILSAISKYINQTEFAKEFKDFSDDYLRSFRLSYVKQLREQYFPDEQSQLQIKLENNPPFAIFEQNGQISGLAADVMRDACDILGFDCIVQNNSLESWESMFSDLKNNRIDVLAPVTKTEERETYLNFSAPIYTSDYFMLKRADYQTHYSNVYELLSEDIGLVSGDVKQEYLEKLFPEKEFTFYPTNVELIIALKKGEIDYAMINDLTFDRYLLDTNDFNVVIDQGIGKVLSSDICFGFPDTVEGEKMAELFSLAMDNINLTEIKNNYVPTIDDERFYHLSDTFRQIIIVGLIALSIILSTSLFFSIRAGKKSVFESNHDFLTKLLNRRGFLKILSKWEDKSFVIIFIDIDNFKDYNDLKGHNFGDEVLRRLSNRLNKLTNPRVRISRFGGDEFNIVYQTDDHEEVLAMVNAIQTLIAEDIKIDLFQCFLSASIGVSSYPADGKNIDDIIHKAELAMNEAKKPENTRVVYFNQELGNKVINTTEIVEQLKLCINQDGFEMVYQPQIDAKTNNIIALEALLRIKGSKLSPGIFVPIAEKHGLMIDIGRIVIQKVLSQMALWKDKKILFVPIYINLSETQFHDYKITEIMSTLLKQYNIDPRLVGIEITENVFVDKESLVLMTLNEFKKIGVHTAIDDFGSGQAGINYLSNFDVDLVKIDKSIVDKYLNDKNEIIFQTIVNLCETLGFDVLAEGVEEKSQVERLLNMNVNLIQGYYFYRPLTVSDIESKLTKI